MFHVKEEARIIDHPILFSSSKDGNNGAFLFNSIEPGWQLYVIASDSTETEEKWEHVSVHASNGKKMRTPTWKEMCYIKDNFWDDEDIVMQLHPKKSEYVNCHPYTLHLWRPINKEIP